MKIIETQKRTDTLITQLLEIWEASVRATHLFLSDSEITSIKHYVPQALLEVSHLIVVQNDDGLPVGFMGINGHMLEMLFLYPDVRGNGLGKELLSHGIRTYAVSELAVNEQNPLAKGFYEHMGFHVVKRTEQDEQGNPYPLLYMKRK